MTANHQAYLEAPYHAQNIAVAAWEQRCEDLRTVRPLLVEALAEILDCELRTRIEPADLRGLRLALGAWLDGLEDGELEDRIAVEVGVIAEWERP